MSGHLLCVRREIAVATRFDPAFDGVQDFEFMLRVSETQSPNRPHPTNSLPLAKNAGQHRRSDRCEAANRRAPAERRQRSPGPPETSRAWLSNRTFPIG